MGIENGRVLGIENGRVLGIENGRVLGTESGRVGPLAPPRTACRLRLSTCPATGIAPKIRSLLFR
jgi:hypothetical protein